MGFFEWNFDMGFRWDLPMNRDSSVTGIYGFIYGLYIWLLYLYGLSSMGINMDPASHRGWKISVRNS